LRCFILLCVLSSLACSGSVALDNDQIKCLSAPEGSSESFGFSVAAIGRAILVGDPGANRVWVYEQGQNGFEAVRAFQPPSGSDAAAFGNGFGRAIDFASNGAIVIGAFAEEALGVAPRRQAGDGFRRLSEVFVARDMRSPVDKVSGLNALTETETFGFSVTRTGDYVGIGLRAIAGERYGLSSVLVIDLADGDQTRIEAPTADAGVDFGFALASSGNVLAIGAPWLSPAGGAVIYDLAAGNQSTVATSQDTPRTGFSVTTDGQRFALGGEATVIADKSDDAWVVSKTLASANGIVAIGNGRVATLREATRNRGIGERPSTPPLDLTLTIDGVTTSSRLAQPGKLGSGNWPYRSIAATDDFAVIGRPSEVRSCKVAVVEL